jgi:hypothetical protein
MVGNMSFELSESSCARKYHLISGVNLDNNKITSWKPKLVSYLLNEHKYQNEVVSVTNCYKICVRFAARALSSLYVVVQLSRPFGQQRSHKFVTFQFRVLFPNVILLVP